MADLLFSTVVALSQLNSEPFELGYCASWPGNLNEKAFHIVNEYNMC